ncbi:MAG TPA: DUF6134 family protein, partial [Phnomibacter sp.]|nr:DUF6134 family protein [Phnomibacter sp.]
TLYFQEPVGRSELYSEGHKRMIPIRDLGNGIYKITMPDGNTNLFYYRGGQLERIVAHTSFGEVVFVKK